MNLWVIAATIMRELCKFYTMVGDDVVIGVNKFIVKFIRENLLLNIYICTCLHHGFSKVNKLHVAVEINSS